MEKTARKMESGEGNSHDLHRGTIPDSSKIRPPNLGLEMALASAYPRLIVEWRTVSTKGVVTATSASGNCGRTFLRRTSDVCIPPCPTISPLVFVLRGDQHYTNRVLQVLVPRNTCLVWCNVVIFSVYILPWPVPLRLYLQVLEDSRGRVGADDFLSFKTYSNQGEPGSIPGLVTGFSHVGIVPQRCRWSAFFLGGLPFPPPFHSGAAPYSPQLPSSALNTSLAEPHTPIGVPKYSHLQGTYQLQGCFNGDLVISRVYWQHAENEGRERRLCIGTDLKTKKQSTSSLVNARATFLRVPRPRRLSVAGESLAAELTSLWRQLCGARLRTQAHEDAAGRCARGCHLGYENTICGVELLGDDLAAEDIAPPPQNGNLLLHRRNNHQRSSIFATGRPAGSLRSKYLERGRPEEAACRGRRTVEFFSRTLKRFTTSEPPALESRTQASSSDACHNEPLQTSGLSVKYCSTLEKPPGMYGRTALGGHVMGMPLLPPPPCRPYFLSRRSGCLPAGSGSEFQSYGTRGERCLLLVFSLGFSVFPTAAFRRLCTLSQVSLRPLFRLARNDRSRCSQLLFAAGVAAAGDVDHHAFEREGSRWRSGQNTLLPPRLARFDTRRGRPSQDFRTWGSWRTMPLICGFFLRSPVSSDVPYSYNTSAVLRSGRGVGEKHFNHSVLELFNNKGSLPVIPVITAYSFSRGKTSHLVDLQITAIPSSRAGEDNFQWSTSPKQNSLNSRDDNNTIRGGGHLLKLPAVHEGKVRFQPRRSVRDAIRECGVDALVRQWGKGVTTSLVTHVHTTVCLLPPRSATEPGGGGGPWSTSAPRRAAASILPPCCSGCLSSCNCCVPTPPLSTCRLKAVPTSQALRLGTLLLVMYVAVSSFMFPVLLRLKRREKLQWFRTLVQAVACLEKFPPMRPENYGAQSHLTLSPLQSSRAQPFDKQYASDEKRFCETVAENQLVMLVILHEVTMEEEICRSSNTHKHTDEVKPHSALEDNSSVRHDGNTARHARRSDETLGVRVNVARIAPSLLNLGRAVPPQFSPCPASRKCSRVLQAPSRTVGFTRQFHTLSSIPTTSTSLAVVPQSPVVVHT
ncbi:hypothetical protein PR048_020434 [Dryococelus australis]|uniref:Transmembrane protein n=1 Tax=Dryococelus australis TaxID=614101 RepID=A0ABQ9H6A8_9NEOP|nr:hypothetical protein PR048_020434 [Dryococelus australis]